MNIKPNTLLLLLITITGIALRLYRIDFITLNLAEVTTLILAKHPLNFEFLNIIAKDNTPPLFQIIMHFWIQFFPINEFSLRIPSFFAGLMAMYYAYQLGVSEKKHTTATIYYALITFNFYAIIYSQYARSNSLFLALSLAILNYWYRQKPLALFITLTLALYTHLFALIFCIALMLTTYILRASFIIIKSTYFAIILSLLFYAPWFFKYISLRILTTENFWIAPPSFKVAVEILGIYINSYIFIIFFIVICFLHITSIMKNKQLYSFKLGSSFLIGIIFFSLILLKSLISTSVFLPRYFIPLLPLIMIFFVETLEVFNNKTIVKIIIISFLVLNMTDNYLFRRQRNNPTSDLDHLVNDLLIKVKQNENINIAIIDNFKDILNYHLAKRSIVLPVKSYSANETNISTTLKNNCRAFPCNYFIIATNNQESLKLIKNNLKDQTLVEYKIYSEGAWLNLFHYRF
jgi:4-amino-4-deoxy-L-arabinose transferase-like glycosyltransferase